MPRPLTKAEKARFLLNGKYKDQKRAKRALDKSFVIPKEESSLSRNVFYVDVAELSDALDE